ncbi:MAG: glycosyltransferase [Thiotrichales bacterium]
MPHLWLALSAHGYGHLAQAAPVVNALAQRLPDLRLTVQSELPLNLLEERFQIPVTRVDHAGDVVIPMNGPTEVRWREAALAYRDFHRDWGARLESQRALLRDAAVDCLLADVPYLPIAAAASLGIPAVAFCSLNWVDILAAASVPELDLYDVLATMREAYLRCDLFIQPAPSMPMSWLPQRHPIGPVALLGTSRRRALTSHLGLGANTRLVVVSLGGVPAPAVRAWPQLPNVHWLVPENWSLIRADVTTLEALPYSFRDLMASSDLIISKPGYGTFAEAAALGLPVLYIERPDWAESPYLETWLARHLPNAKISLHQFQRGDIASEALRLLDHPRPSPIAPRGIEEAVQILLRHFRQPIA